jgi:PAS domain S-box-containing protein
MAGKKAAERGPDTKEIGVQAGLMPAEGETGGELFDALKGLIGQLKDTQAALRRTEEQLAQARKRAHVEHLRYYDLFEQAPNAYIVTDRDGMVRECNQAMSDLVRRQAKWIIGKPIAMFFALEDRPAFRRLLSKLSESHERQDRELRLSPDKTQGAIYAHATVNPVRDSSNEVVELRWILRDVTRRRRAEAALVESEARHRFLTEHAQDVIFLFDLRPEPHLEYISPAVEQMTGHKPQEFYKDWKQARKLVHPEDAEMLEPYLRKMSMLATPITFRLVHKNGEVIWVEQHATLIRDDEGKTVAVEAILRDVTDRVKAEAQLERLRTEFLVVLAHEFRTPLTAIKGASSIALSSKEPPKPREVQELFTIIDEQAERLRNLIGNLLDVTQIESGLLSLHPEEVDTAKMLEEARQAFTRTSETRKIIMEVPDDLPPLKVDRRRIQQVLVNLLSNAAHVSPGTAPITVSAWREEDKVLVQVRDHGRGIPVEKISQLFRKFSKVDEDADPGAGLGLAICKGLVEAHGGRIWAESDGAGSGAAFTVVLPSAA